MPKNKLDFSQALAEYALQHHFTVKGDTCREFRQLRLDCRDLLSFPNTHRVYAKLIKMELNEKAVNMVIRLLTAEKQRYLHLRYCRKKSLVAMSLALHVSIAQLNLWHHCILEQIARFMLYTLKQEDIFYPARVAQMVRLQGEAISFFSELDPAGRIVTKDWLLALILRHEQYRSLMLEIKRIMSREPKSTYDCVVAARLAHPEEPANVIACLCNVHKGVVSRYLSEFGENMSKYLM